MLQKCCTVRLIAIDEGSKKNKNILTATDECLCVIIRKINAIFVGLIMALSRYFISFPLVDDDLSKTMSRYFLFNFPRDYFYSSH